MGVGIGGASKIFFGIGRNERILPGYAMRGAVCGCVGGIVGMVSECPDEDDNDAMRASKSRHQEL